MKKVKLTEATSVRLYSDIYGWVSSAFFVEYEVPNRYARNKKRLALNQVFIKKGNGHHYNATIQNLMDNRDELFYEEYDYTGRKFYKKIEGSQITVSWQGITTKKELSKVEVYEIDAETPYRVLMDYEIHKGLLVMFAVENGVSKDKNRAGTYVVTECFEQPNRENKFCIVEPLVTFEGDQRNAIVINTESKQLYTVPYAEYAAMPNELDVFNHPICEPELQSLMRCEADGHQSSIKKANLFWQPIEEASAYTVSLYYYNSSEQLKNKLYLLQRFEVERNVHWLTIENLMGNCKFIVMLEAEDRQGNIIARTRGIDVANGKPQWW